MDSVSSMYVKQILDAKAPHYPYAYAHITTYLTRLRRYGCMRLELTCASVQHGQHIRLEY